MDIEILMKQGHSLTEIHQLTGIGKTKLKHMAEAVNYKQYRKWQRQTLIRRIKRLIACHHDDLQIATRLNVSISKMRSIRLRHIDGPASGKQIKGTKRNLEHRIRRAAILHPEYSSIKLASFCGCNRATVAKYRKQLT